MSLGLEPARLEGRYGKNAEGYSLVEAGHAAQNALLQATAMGVINGPIRAATRRKVRAKRLPDHPSYPGRNRAGPW